VNARVNSPFGLTSPEFHPGAFDVDV
jgi:hypothetical protein